MFMFNNAKKSKTSHTALASWAMMMTMMIALATGGAWADTENPSTTVALPVYSDFELDWSKDGNNNETPLLLEDGFKITYNGYYLTLVKKAITGGEQDTYWEILDAGFDLLNRDQTSDDATKKNAGTYTVLVGINQLAEGSGGGVKFTREGTHDLYIVGEAGSQINYDTVSVTWEIKKKPVSAPEFVAQTNFPTYKGTDFHPEDLFAEDKGRKLKEYKGENDNNRYEFDFVALTGGQTYVRKDVNTTDYDVFFELTDEEDNYEWEEGTTIETDGTVKLSWNIIPVTIDADNYAEFFTIDGFEKTYNGIGQTATVGFASGNITSGGTETVPGNVLKLTYQFNSETATVNKEDVGTYKILATVDNTNAPNFAEVSSAFEVTEELEIKPLTLTAGNVSWTDAFVTSLVYEASRETELKPESFVVTGYDKDEGVVTIDGTNISVEITSTTDSEREPWISAGLSAGQVTVKLTLGEDVKNFVIDDAEGLELTYDIKPAEVTQPTLNTTTALTYNNTEQTISFTTASELYSFYNNTDKATNAGTHIATVVLTDARNYEWDISAGPNHNNPIERVWTIGQASLTNASIGGLENVMFINPTTGVKPEITVTMFSDDALETLTEGTHYTVTWGTNNVPGNNNGTVTIESINGTNFDGGKTETFNINNITIKQENYKTYFNLDLEAQFKNLKYNGEVHKVNKADVTVKPDYASLQSNQWDILHTVKDAGATGGDISPENAGDYDVYIVVSLNAAFFKEGSHKIGTYKIAPTGLTAAFFDVTGTENPVVYKADSYANGQVTATFKPGITNEGANDLTVKFYQNNSEVENPINVGTYDIKVSVAEGGQNFIATPDADASEKLVIRQLTLAEIAEEPTDYFTISPIPDVRTYGGNDLTEFLGGTFSVAWTEPYLTQVNVTLSGPKNEEGVDYVAPESAGDYGIFYSIPANTNSNVETGLVRIGTYTINRKAVARPVLSGNTDLVYTTVAQTVTVTENQAAYAISGDLAGTNAGTYTVTSTPNSNHTWTEKDNDPEPDIQNWTIAQLPLTADNVTVALVGVSDLVYNGESQVPASFNVTVTVPDADRDTVINVALADGGVIDITDNDVHPNSVGTNVGTVAVSVAGPESGNFSGTVPLTYPIAPKPIEKPVLARAAFPFNNNPHTVVLKPEAAIYGLLESGDITQTAVGPYTAKVGFNNGSGESQDKRNHVWIIPAAEEEDDPTYSNADFPLEWEVKKADLLNDEHIVVEIDDNDGAGYTYEGVGVEHEPAVKVWLGKSKGELILGTDYTVAYDNNVNAGDSAKIIITAADGQESVVNDTTVYFTIAKAELTEEHLVFAIPPSPQADVTNPANAHRYNGDVRGIGTLGLNTDLYSGVGNIDVLYKIAGQDENVDPKDANTYNINVVAEEGDNFLAADFPLKQAYVIGQSVLARPTSASFSNAGITSYSGTEQGPVITFDENRIVEGETVADAYVITGTVKATDAGDYIVAVTPASNYRWDGTANILETISHDWSIAKADLAVTHLDITVAPNVTYTGNSLADSVKVAFTAPYTNGSVNPTVVFKRGSVNVDASEVVNVDTYEIFVSLADGGVNFNEAVELGVVRQLVIDKAAAPGIAWPTGASSIIYGKKLLESELVFSLANPDHGTFAWTNGDVYPTVQNNGYEVTFTPSADDLANFNYDAEGVVLTYDVPLTVAKAPLTITGLSHSKTFDGTNEATDVAVTVGGVLQVATEDTDDDVTVSVVANYNSNNVGSNQLTVAGTPTLSGVDASNYVVVASSYANPFTVVGIYAKAAEGLAATAPNTISIAYDDEDEETYSLSNIGLASDDNNYGTVSYILGTLTDDASIFSKAPALSGSDIKFTGNGKTSGTATLPVTVVTQNYENVTVNLTFDATSKGSATVSIAAITDVTYGDDVFTPVVTAVNSKNGDPVVIAQGDLDSSRYAGTLASGGNYPSSAVQPREPGTYTVYVVLNNDSYTGSSSANFTILPKTLTWADTGTVADRAYIHNNTVAEVVKVPALGGIINNDVVTHDAGAVNFAKPTVDTNKIAVTASDWGITGADAWKYTAPAAQPVFASANIYKAEQGPLVISPIADKTYGDLPFGILSSIDTSKNLYAGVVGHGFTFSVKEGSEDVGEINSSGTVTIKSVGNLVIEVTYSGDANYNPVSGEVTVKVNPKAIVAANFAAIDTQVYNHGGAITPEVVLAAGVTGVTFSDPVYSNNEDVGTASVKVTGTGNYGGEVTLTFAISALALSADFFNEIESVVYTGNAITPAVSLAADYVGKVTYGSVIGYEFNVNVSDTARAVVSGTGNYTGTAFIPFSITPKPITAGDFAAIGEQLFKGSAIEPAVALANSGSGVTFTVGAYSDNTDVGTASVKVYGSGNYGDSVTLVFNILPVAGTVDVTQADWTYGDAVVAPVHSSTNTGADVTVVYVGRAPTVYNESPVAPTNAGTYTVKVTYAATNNYNAATGTADFSIIPRTVTAGLFTVPSKVYTGSRIELTAGDITAAPGVDFTVQSNGANLNVAGGGTVTVAGTVNYTGTVELPFPITPKPVLLTDFTLEGEGGEFENGNWSFPYADGDAVTPAVVLANVLSGVTFWFGEYSNNNDRGSASVKAWGTGNYGDTVTINFGIGVKLGTVTVSIEDWEYGSTPSALVHGSLTNTDAADTTVLYTGRGTTVYNSEVQPVNAGTYRVTVTYGEVENYSKASAYADFEITRKAITAALFNPIDTVIYTGLALTPAVTADGLVQGTDFTAPVYSHHTNAGTATATVDGIGNYTGRAELDFVITRKPLAVANFSAIPAYNFTGSAITPPVSLAAGVTGVTYTVGAYSNNTNAGTNTASVKVTGTGNYGGEVTLYFTINAAAGTVTVTQAGWTYGDEAVAPVHSSATNAGAAVTVVYYGTGYDESEEPPVNAGTYTVKVTYAATANRAEASATANFQIAPRAVTAELFNAIASVVYTGSAIEPAVTAKSEDVTVSETVNYANNTNAGTATATVSGTGNYTGYVGLPFTITPKSIVAANFAAIGAQTYTGLALTPAVLLATGVTGVTYTTAYSDNTNVGTASVKVTGSGNYGGEVTLTFNIVQSAAGAVTVTQAGWIYGATSIPALVHSSATNTGATATVRYTGRGSTEYDSTARPVNAGTYRVTVTYAATGNYAAASAYADFTIGARVITTDLFNTILPVVYTGSAHTPAVTAPGLTVGTDFTAPVYGNNTNAGTGTATVDGIGNYTGRAVIPFTVTPKPIDAADFAPIAAQLFTGSALTPAVVRVNAVTIGDPVYSNNTNVGTASVKVTGTGNYGGEITLTFVISEVIGAVVVSIDSVWEYGATPGALAHSSATNKDATVTVLYTGVGSTVYNSAVQPVNAGDYSVTVTYGAIGDYLPASASAEFRITRKGITTALFNAIAPVVYTGSAHTPAVTAVTGSDVTFSAAYSNNTNAGTASAVVTGTGNYSGSINLPFTITRKPVVLADFAPIPQQTHTGSAVTPAVTLANAGSGVTFGFGQYSNNISAGAASVKAWGTGNYGDTVTISFGIGGAVGSVVVSIASTWEYGDTTTGVLQHSSVTNADADVTVLYTGRGTTVYSSATKPVNAGTYRVTVTYGATDDYFETFASADFEIARKAITSAQFAAVPAQVYTGSALEPAVSLAAGVTGVTFTTVYTGDNVNVGTTAKATVTGTGNYTGSVERTFTITPKPVVASDFATIPAQVYTGAAHTPAVALANPASGVTFLSGSYSNNTNVGTASVKAWGTGNYGDTVTLTFAINAATILSSHFAAIGALTYTGAELKPAVLLAEGVTGVTYSVAYSNNINASTATATATATVTGTGAYSGTVQLPFTINPAAIPAAQFAAIGAQVYTGSALTPAVSLATGFTGVTFTTAYADNVNAGTAKATVTGTGNYTGSEELSFTITPKPVAVADFAAIPAQTFTGSALTPAVALANPASGVTYTVGAYSNNTAVGNASVKVYGSANYGDSVTLTFAITSATIASSQFAAIGAQTYTGAALTPAVSLAEGVTGVTYDVTYSNNTNAGTATATVTGTGAYSGTVQLSFTINPAAITAAQFAAIDAQTYTGSALTPTVSLDSGVTGVTFTTAYADNINVGTATATVTGTGNYAGTAELSFVINPAAVTASQFAAIGAQVYTGSALEPAVSLATGVTGVTFTTAYANNVNVGTATVTVTGTGNYAGTVSLSFTVNPSAISASQFAAIGAQTYTGSALTPAVSLATGVTGVTFTTAYADNVNVGTATVTVTGTGSYSGTVSLSFTIGFATITAELFAAIPAQAYTGLAREPAVALAPGVTGVTFVTDYYSNNVNAGEATVIVSGTGNYTGTVALSFTINPPVTFYATVIGGRGSDSYKAGDTVVITSGLSPDGKKFTGWSSTVTGLIKDDKLSKTTFVMPAQDVTVTANYADYVVPSFVVGAPANGKVRIFVSGDPVEEASLAVYDATGNLLSKIKVSDNAKTENGENRQVAEWDMKSNGRKVPDGTYLLKGVVKTADGKSKRVSALFAVR